MLNIFRAQFRSRRYRTQRNTIEVLRFSTNGRPTRVRGLGFELFHKPRVIRSTLLIGSVSLVVIWALKSYIDIFRHISV